MGYDLIRKLKPWVTTFSAGIKLKFNHGDELCIGGRITNIFDLTEKMSDQNYMIQINVDDNVGEITIMLPKKIYLEKFKKLELKLGDTILAHGRIFDPYNELKQKKEEENIPSLLCWNLELLNSKED